MYSLAKRKTAEEASGSQDRTIHSEILDPERLASAYIEHEVDETCERGNTSNIDLGQQYVDRLVEAMEEWLFQAKEMRAI